jgi:hypothetical protein
MQNKVLDTIEQSNERLPAAFLVPTDQLSLYETSEKFWSDNHHLLPDGFGVIAQIGQPGSSRRGAIPPTESLTFDARQRNAGVYLWQIINAGQEGMQIWQISSQSNLISGNLFNMPERYKPAEKQPLRSMPFLERIVYLRRLLASPEVNDQIDLTRQTHKKRNTALTQFKQDKSMSFEYSAENINGDYVKIKGQSRLSEKEYKKELKKRKKDASSSGFIPLKPYEAKPSCVRPVDPNGQFFFSPSDQVVHEAKEVVLPSDDLDSVNKLLVEDCKVRLGELVSISKKLIPKVDQYTTTEFMETPTAIDLLNRQIALSAIKKGLVPVAYERFDAYLPDGIYKIGDNVYRRDESGFYVVGENGFGVKDYLALAVFSTPCSYQRATEKHWIELAADIEDLLSI